MKIFVLWTGKRTSLKVNSSSKGRKRLLLRVKWILGVSLSVLNWWKLRFRSIMTFLTILIFFAYNIPNLIIFFINFRTHRFLANLNYTKHIFWPFLLSQVRKKTPSTSINRLVTFKGLFRYVINFIFHKWWKKLTARIWRKELFSQE